MIEDSYCQGPKPKESEFCEAGRRRREDRSTADGKHGLPSVRSSTLTRQNDFIKAAQRPAKAALSSAAGEDQYSNDLSSRAGQTESPSDLSCLIETRYINALPNKKTDLISLDASNKKLSKIHQDRLKIDKRSRNILNDEEEKADVHKIKKNEIVIDKEDIRNLTLTIILERDEKNIVTNFPKNFKPQPPENSTEFTLVGMDALRYIQKIQEEARTFF